MKLYLLLSFTSGAEYIQNLKTEYPGFDTIVNGISGNVYAYLKPLAAIFIAFIMINGILKTLASGGQEPINPFEHIFKPLMFIVVIIFWNQLLGTIDWLSYKIGDSITAGVLNETVAKTMYEKIAKITEEYWAKDGFWKNVTKIFSGKGSQLFMFSLQKTMFDFMSSIRDNIEEASYLMFFLYQQTILTILKIVGIISLTLSFTGKIKSFWTWVVSFLGVQLWLPIALLSFTIIDKMTVLFVNNMYEGFLTLPAGDKVMVEMIWAFPLTFLIFGILKLVLMFKTPQIVNMFLGGAGASGAMFGAMFAPVKMASETIKAGVSGGANIAMMKK